MALRRLSLPLLPLLFAWGSPLSPQCGLPYTTLDDPWRAVACANHRDDDGDGAADWPDDPGCASPADPDEAGPVAPACADGFDNDEDGLVDGADPGCADFEDSIGKKSTPR